MSEISVRAFDALAHMSPDPRIETADTKAIAEALHLLERLEADRRNRRKVLSKGGSKARAATAWRIER